MEEGAQVTAPQLVMSTLTDVFFVAVGNSSCQKMFSVVL